MNDFGSAVSGDDFRIIVDGGPSAPLNYDNLSFNVPYASSQKFPVVFAIDDSVQQFDIRLMLDSSTQIYHVDLTTDGGTAPGSAAPDGGAP